MTHADSIWAKALEAHSDSLQSKVDLLQTKLDALEGKTEFFANVVETANDGVSNQLSAANCLLTIVGVIVTIAAIWLGVQIEKKWHKMQSMAATVDEKKKIVTELAKIVDEKKEKVDIIAKATEDLDQKIHSNLSALYKDLRNEETNALLERLIIEPRDISNLSDLLLTRSLSEEGFPKLKEAFLKYLEEQGDQIEVVTANGIGSENYLGLLFQHFFYRSIKDDLIRPRLIDHFHQLFEMAFKRDIIKSTEDLCKALSDEDSSFNKEDVLVDYLKALNNSKHKSLSELKNIFEKNITPQSLLQSAINRCTTDQVYLELFGVTSPDCGETTPQQNGEG